MFCENCGNKLKNEDLFCEKCGNKTNNEKKKEIERKPMDKKSKMIIIIVSIVLIVLVSLFIFFQNITSPKTITKKYLEALKENDTDKLYSLLDVEGDKTFLSKEIFKNGVLDDNEKIKIENYKIKDINYSASKLSANVKVALVLKNTNSLISSTPKEIEKIIPLTKSKEKKYLFFDKWTISKSINTASITENFKITVPKNSVLKYDSKKVDKSYLDKSMSTDKLDVYVLKQVFSYKTDIEVTLPSGFVIKDSIKPGYFYNSYKARVSLDKMDEKDKKQLKEKIKNDLQIMYDNIIKNETFNNFKTKIDIDKKEIDDVKEEYEDVLEELKEATNKLTKMTVNDIELYTIGVSDDGDISVRFKASYNYTVKYMSYNDEEKVKDSKGSKYIYFDYKISKEKNKVKYTLTDVDNLIDYFSRY